MSNGLNSFSSAEAKYVWPMNFNHSTAKTDNKNKNLIYFKNYNNSNCMQLENLQKILHVNDRIKSYKDMLHNIFCGI